MTYIIKRLVGEAYENTKLTFKEAPAPAPTLAGYLLSLEAETGFQHVAMTAEEWGRREAVEVADKEARATAHAAALAEQEAGQQAAAEAARVEREAAIAGVVAEQIRKLDDPKGHAEAVVNARFDALAEQVSATDLKAEIERLRAADLAKLEEGRVA